MGLDMYLYAEKYESKHLWCIENLENRREQVKGFCPEDLEELMEYETRRGFIHKTTRYAIGYWRKFNILHDIISGNVSEDVLSCGVYLYHDDIENIIDELKLKLSFDIYDDYDIDNINYTIELFEKCLKLIDKGYDIVYRASW